MANQFCFAGSSVCFRVLQFYSSVVSVLISLISDTSSMRGLNFIYKQKHRKFCLNMRKNFFPLRVMEHWNRLSREVVESPSLEIFKTHLDKVLCSLL